MRASAIAHPNIALVKYWGKRDAKVMLPLAGSIGLTLDALTVHTTVSFEPELTADELSLDGRPADAEALARVSELLQIMREAASVRCRARVTSRANFALSSGLASSAAGFAALATAGAAALGLPSGRRELSVLARRGSGSACRSVLGGFVEWLPGQAADGQDSFAVELAAQDFWPELRVVVCSIAGGAKTLSSRAAMDRAQRTSPLFAYWLAGVGEALPRMRHAIARRDLTLLGEIAEANCLQMHATVFTSSPPHSYWNEATAEVLRNVVAARRAGSECYFTIDAGPHVKILCRAQELDDLIGRLRKLPAIAAVTVCAPGPQSCAVESHLCG